MVFHSLEFLVFFGVVAICYFAAPLRARWIVLLAASLYFYGASEPVFLIQILAATGVCYWLALRLSATENQSNKKRLLTFGIVLLVANLVAFKYSELFNETLRAMFGWAGAHYPVPTFQVWLPIGISFYTFQLISYLVDVYRGGVPERHLGLFAVYVTFFPKVIAGPIERAKNLLPQLHLEHRLDYAQAVNGLQLMLWGAFKKVVVADRIAPFVSSVYDNPTAHDGVEMAFATWLYAFQIYFDFSGYTDIALGAALILGFKLSPNFNRPYIATSISDFWKRWHISLTSWLTDYVYTPFTRQRRIKMKFYNLMLLGLFITFVVSGFWHGAQWTFVAWGMLHGLYIVVSLQTQKVRTAFSKRVGLLARPKLHRVIKIFVTFNLVSFAYILFRANSFGDAIYIIQHLLTGWSRAPWTIKEFVYDGFAEFTLAAAGIVLIMWAESWKTKIDLPALLARRPVLRWSMYYAGALSIVLLGAFYGMNQQFIYFRF